MKLSLLPLILAAILFASVFISYSISVSLRHVPAVLPYISDAGVQIPERNAFSLLINFGAFLQAFLVYVRFRFVLTTAKGYFQNKVLILLNRLGLVLGVTSSFGLTLVGNFQLQTDNDFHAVNLNQTLDHLPGDQRRLMALHHHGHAHPEFSSHVQLIHWSGAFFAFVGGIAWMFVQNHVSRIIGQSAKLIWSRIVLAVTSVLALITGVALACVAATYKDETGNLSWDDSDHSLDTFRGQLSVAAAFCEWVVALMVVAFTLTFHFEFRGYGIEGFHVVRLSHPMERDLSYTLSSTMSSSSCGPSQQFTSTMTSSPLSTSNGALSTMPSSTSTITECATLLTHGQKCV